MKKNWLITGGCGFIGTSLIATLQKLDKHINIRVLDNLSTGSKDDLEEVTKFTVVSNPIVSPSGVELYIGDVRNYQNCISATMGCDCIVHLAANTGVGPSVEDPRLDMEANVVGTFNILDASRINRVDKFIFASSGAPIGELLTPPIHEELPAHPVSPYGASKLAGEGYCSAYYKSFNINTIALRFGNVYGPRSKRKSSVVAKFIKLAIDGIPCEIYGDGVQTRDFIYINDLVDSILKASETDVGGEVFQIATSKESTVNEITKVIKEKLKKRNIEMKIIHTSKRVGDVMRNFSDTSKAERKLKWKAKTTLDEGIAKTIEYFLKNPK